MDLDPALTLELNPFVRRAAAEPSHIAARRLTADLVAVCFVESEGDTRRCAYVVDFYTRVGGGWRSTARYSTPLGASPDAAASQVARPPGIDDQTTQTLRELEDELAHVALGGFVDRDAMARLIAANFVQRVADAPERTLGRDAWARGSGRYRIEAIRQHDYAARVLADDVAVLSLQLDQRASFAGRDRSGEFHVVDVWIRRHAGWQLAARYSSPIGKTFDRPAPA